MRDVAANISLTGEVSIYHNPLSPTLLSIKKRTEPVEEGSPDAHVTELLNETEVRDRVECSPKVEVGDSYGLALFYPLGPVLNCTQQLCYTGPSGSETVLAVG